MTNAEGNRTMLRELKLIAMRLAIAVVLSALGIAVYVGLTEIGVF